MDKVIIGPMVFSIREADELCDESKPDGEEMMDGTVDHGIAEIALSTALCPQVKRIVLWHEIFHAILVQAGIRDHNEQLIDALSYGIVGVLQANPPLRELVQE